jgi:penicillin-binding protein 1C
MAKNPKAERIMLKIANPKNPPAKAMTPNSTNFKRLLCFSVIFKHYTITYFAIIYFMVNRLKKFASKFPISKMEPSYPQKDGFSSNLGKKESVSGGQASLLPAFQPPKPDTTKLTSSPAQKQGIHKSKISYRTATPVLEQVKEKFVSLPAGWQVCRLPTALLSGVKRICRAGHPPESESIWQRGIKRYRKTIIFLLILCLTGGLLYLFWDLPAPWRLTSWPYPVSTQIFDRNGQLLYEIYADQNRTPMSLADLPESIKWATIAAEDKDFYSHHGVSFPGIARALFNIVFHQKLQGGSTITQQLVKTALLTPERTVKRKAREFILTLATEIMYPKDKILEMYLNHIPYGGTAWGIESASRLYFGKSARQLSLAESALLAGLPASPTRYSPFGANPRLAKERQVWVLDRMVEDKFLDKEAAEKAKNEELVFAPQGNEIKAPHFVMYVKEQLVEKYGQRTVEQGGLRVKTTLDLSLQEFAQKTTAEEVNRLTKAKGLNAGVLVTRPQTGEILAMVGSKDYFSQDIQGNFNVTTALRQPGSSIKPLNYALGLLTKKVTPATVFNDLPTCFKVSGQALYCPSNYDNTFRGPVQLRFALGNSLNIPAVKMLALNGLEDFVAFCQKMGLETISDPKQYGLSLTLGGGEVRMTDMAVAFGVFANAGRKQPLISILEVSDYTGKVLEKAEINQGEPVLSEQVAYLISHILLDNNARMGVFGPSSYLVISGHPEVSVKTGTSNDKRDNWTIGYNPDILVVVWAGNNDNKPMWSVASGSAGSSPIFNKTIRYALRQIDMEKYSEKIGKPVSDLEAQKITPPAYPHWPQQPDGIVGASVCTLSGLLPKPEEPCSTRYEYFLEGTVPQETENLTQTILVNKTNGQPIQPGENGSNQLPEWIEPQTHKVIIDPLQTVFCLDCPPLPPDQKSSAAIIKPEDLLGPTPSIESNL